MIKTSNKHIITVLTYLLDVESPVMFLSEVKVECDENKLSITTNDSEVISEILQLIRKLEEKDKLTSLTITDSIEVVDGEQRSYFKFVLEFMSI